jgi:uncharacterized protein (UPF0548 family)
MPIRLRRPSAQILEQLLEDASGHQVTYAEVGATRGPELPSGYSHDRHSVALGQGDLPFALGADALRRWRPQLNAGAILTPPLPKVEIGTTVLTTFPLQLGFAIVPCRIVYVTEDAHAFGFAYGTLPGHPERGEEAFHVRRDGDGLVTFEIVAFSRPALLLTRLGHPVARRTQARTTRAYLAAVFDYVKSGGAPS